ncbi:MAG: response regulator transcription factor [Myxococcales bacterium]|nr:response regulator transcription factor [Myxococcales bacterium]
MVAVPKAQIAIVDDHPLFREGLLLALRGVPDVEVVGAVANAADALLLAEQVNLDLCVVDILMPIVSGISLTGQMLSVRPACKILALSVIDEPVLIADMLRAGASGYAVKTQPTAEIIDAIHGVLGGLRYLPPRVSRDAIEAELAATAWRPLENLTRRERQVFDLLIRGQTNDQISDVLVIARRTVETHRQRIMNKLSARSVVEMIRIAARHGELDR